MTKSSVSNGQATPLPRLHSVAEVATMFGRAPRTIRGWIARGLLKATKIGNSVFISPAQIDALVAMPEPSDPASFEAKKMPEIAGRYYEFQEHVQVILGQ